MFESTQKKLREAEFFFAQLDRASAEVVRNEPEAFDFYLSAFLSAARSVSFVLRNETKEEYGALFDNWAKSISEIDKQLWDFLKEQRNRSEKRGVVDVKTQPKHLPLSEIQRRNPQSHPAWGVTWFGPPGTPEPTIRVEQQFFEFFGESTEVVTACRDYLKGLKGLVAAFREKE